MSLARQLVRTGRTDEAEAAFQDAVELWKKLVSEAVTLPEDRRDLVLCYNVVGIVLFWTQRPDEAEAVYEAALAIAQKLVAEVPKQTEYHNDLAGILVNLALVWRVRQEPARARDLLRQAEPHHRPAMTDGGPGMHPTLSRDQRGITDICVWRAGEDGRVAGEA